MTRAAPTPARSLMLDRFCPMHVAIGPTGQVLHAGPTLQKILAPAPMIGAAFLALFELIRPRAVQDAAGLRDLDGARLRLRLRAHPRHTLKGQLCVLPPNDADAAEGPMILNLAFGISLVDAVRDFGLSAADFAVTDLATEMLYLCEAKTVAMEESHRLNRRLEDSRHAAQQQALTDTLTGLPNRRAFDTHIAQAVRSGQGFALLHLDLDYFKQVNDTHGHAAGDLVLRVAAQRMQSVVRAQDVLARVGGDEFVLLLPGIESTAAVEAVALRLIATLEDPVRDGSRLYRISASIGATLSRDHPGCALTEIMNAADRALYASKTAGRGCYRVHRGPYTGPQLSAKAHPVLPDDPQTAAICAGHTRGHQAGKTDAPARAPAGGESHDGSGLRAAAHGEQQVDNDRDGATGGNVDPARPGAGVQGTVMRSR